MPALTKTSRSAEPMLRIGTAAGIPQALRSLGLDPHQVLSQSGFDPGIFDDPDNLISFAARSRLIAHCTEKSGCQHFGLLVGQYAGLYSLGLVGLLMRYSADVGVALNNLERYFQLHAHGVSTRLQTRGDMVILGFQIHQNRAPAISQTADGAIAIMFNIMRELCRPGWKPTEIWFMHSEPEDLEPYRAFFRTRLRFNAEQNAIVFDSACLMVKLPEVHPELRRMVQKQIDAMVAQLGDDFPAQVRSVLRAALLSGNIRTDRVAALFSMHPRTLHRRLEAVGMHYRELVDEMRFEMAQQMLEGSSLDVSQIALILLYADARSFIRAFRRWSGATPARWRATQKQQRKAFTRQSRPAKQAD